MTWKLFLLNDLNLCRPGKSCLCLQAALLLCLLCVCHSPQDALAQTSETDVESTVTTQSWQDSLEKLKGEKEADLSNQAFDEESKKKLVELYAEIESKIKTIKEYKAQVQTWRDDAMGAEKLASELETQIQQLKPPTPSESAANPDLSTLRNRETELQISVNQQTALVNELTNQINTRPSNKKTITEEITGIPNSITAEQELLSKINDDVTEELPKRVNQLTRWKHQAQLSLLNARQMMLQAQLQRIESYETYGVLRKRKTIAENQLENLDVELKRIQKQIKELEKEAVTSVWEKAIRSVEKKVEAFPQFQAELEETQTLKDELDQTVSKSLEVSDALNKLKTELQDLRTEQSNLKTKVEGLQSSYGVGSLLRRQATRLPNINFHKSRLAYYRDLFESNDLVRFEHDQKLEEIETDIKALNQRVSVNEPNSSRETPAEAELKILQAQQTILDELKKYETNLFDDLLSIETHEKELIETAQQFQTYINERILWIRSNQPLWRNYSIDKSDQFLFLPQYWMGVVQKLRDDFRTNIFGWVMVLGGFSYLIVFRGRVRRELIRLGQDASRAKCREMTPTLRALVLTIGLALIFPGLMLVLGWRLRQIMNNDALAINLGQGLMVGGLFLAPIAIMRQVCRHSGLAPAHFQWPSEKTSWGRAVLLRYASSAILPLLVTFTLFQTIGDQGADVIERVCFIIVLLLTAVMCFRMTHPTRGVFGTFFEEAIGTWAYRLRYIWFGIAVGLPVCLAVLVVNGYYHTAIHLSERLYLTVWILVGLLLVKGFLYRLLLIYRRRLMAARAQERLASINNKPEDNKTTPIPAQQEETVRLSDLSDQSRQLINAFLVAMAVGCTWWNWAQELPALQKLDEWYLIEVDQQPNTVTEVASSGEGQTDGGAAPVTAEYQNKDRGLSYADAIIAIFVTFVTLTLSRNLPGLLEIAVLQHLQFEQATRYAITSLITYLIGFAGVMLGAQMLGIGWSQVQWLVTALTFGLGFGLQEIFANFVAGIILLIERPIRVGDIVTVEGTTGSVARIRMRATTIINWDRQEFIIPNKDFITGRLLNWTLTDKINRVVINVGVAYGSDTEKARELLLAVANENTFIMNDPGPIATFEGFGDSTLNLVLRAYLPDLENRLAVIHELHTQINKRFNEAEIEIAFPQLDLHIKQIPKAIAEAREDSQEYST